MKKSDIAYEVYSELENKFVDANIPEKEKDLLYKKLDDLVKDIDIMVEATEEEIEQVIYDYSEEAIKDEKADRVTQDYLERSLF